MGDPVQIPEIYPLSDKQQILFNKTLQKIDNIKTPNILTTSMLDNAIAFGNGSNNVNNVELNKFYSYVGDYFINQYYIFLINQYQFIAQDKDLLDNINSYFTNFDDTGFYDLDQDDQVGIIQSLVNDMFEKNTHLQMYLVNIRYYVLALATLLKQMQNMDKDFNKGFNNFIFSLSINDVLENIKYFFRYMQTNIQDSYSGEYDKNDNSYIYSRIYTDLVGSVNKPGDSIFTLEKDSVNILLLLYVKFVVDGNIKTITTNCVSNYEQYIDYKNNGYIS